MAWIFVFFLIIFFGILLSQDDGEPLGWAILVTIVVAVMSLLISSSHIGQFELEREIPLKAVDGKYAVLEDNDTIIFFTADGWESRSMYNVEIVEGPASLVVERTKKNPFDYISESRYVLTVPSDGISVGSLG